MVHLREVWSITELCASYGISRKTGYKWIDRYLHLGPAGLEERSRRPCRAPNQTPDAIVSAILDARRCHPTWGGKKLLALLQHRHPRWDLRDAPPPATSCAAMGWCRSAATVGASVIRANRPR